MKFMLMLFSIMALQCCRSTSQTVTVQETENTTIEYSAAARNFYQLIKINNDFYSVTSKRTKKNTSQTIDKEKCGKIMSILKTIDVETIANLEAPSKKFQYDGAPLAHLRVILNGTTYESVPFDHGNPPKELVPLVKEILSLAENIE